MNVANVIPLSAPHAVPAARSGPPAALTPVRVRFDAFELDEANALLLRDGKAVTLAPEPFALPAPSPDESKCALPTLYGPIVIRRSAYETISPYQLTAMSTRLLEA
jgi:hypothetical protein